MKFKIGKNRVKIRFDDAGDVTKCLRQIEMSDLFLMCPPSAELPSLIDTKVRTKNLTRTNKTVD